MLTAATEGDPAVGELGARGADSSLLWGTLGVLVH